MRESEWRHDGRECEEDRIVGRGVSGLGNPMTKSDPLPMTKVDGCQGVSEEGGAQCVVVNVYVACSLRDKITLWGELSAIKMASLDPSVGYGCLKDADLGGGADAILLMEWSSFKMDVLVLCY
ncbi:hypothetical protein VNO80_25562 [Phaseolus coccineus]|uniref:Uncharacterized protein n=1 Tax=Phaseolus coccineus TaxID=3886 RepID=A0AAN9QQ86_PHACN